MKLCDAIELAVKNRPSWKSGSGAANALSAVKRCVQVLGPDFDCSTADGTTLVRLRRGLENVLSSRNKPLSPASVNRSLSAFKVVLKELHYAGLLSDVPKSSLLRESPGRFKFYTKEQIELMTEKAFELGSPKMAYAIQVTYLTGIRRQELLNLRFEDIDFISHEVTFVDTKNGEDHVLPMNDDLYNILSGLCSDLTEGDYVFDYLNGDQFYSRFKKVRDACGINSDLVFHSIRHTTGTCLVSSGVPLRTVMGILNHKNVDITLRYAHSTLESKADALSLL